MNAVLQEQTFCAGFFPALAEADRAVAGLLAAGFTREELAVICPERFKDHFSPEISQAEPPSSDAPAKIAGGSAIGAALGGLALAVSAVATGGAALFPGALVLVGGGALAGGFSNLVIADGYDQGIREYYLQAVQSGKIVVGVHVKGKDAAKRLKDAAGILAAAGATSIVPESESNPDAASESFFDEAHS